MNTLNAPLLKINDDRLLKSKIKLFIKREDLIHPHISGNKWRKLKYNVEAFRNNKKNVLLTFGGAFSNHIYSTAAAGKMWGFKTIGIIRGEPTTPLNATLAYAKACGMKLHFVSRSEYRLRNDAVYLNTLIERFHNPYLLPEGGTNDLALKGCAEIIHEIDFDFDYLCTACGTGGTLAGLITGSKQNHHQLLGFSALKGGNFLVDDIQELIKNTPQSDYLNWKIQTDYHFGGYAKFKSPLIDFINNFKKQHQIQLEPIYTGKLFYGIFDLIEKGFFAKGSTIVALHTGGLQGLVGFKQRYSDLIL